MPKYKEFKATFYTDEEVKENPKLINAIKTKELTDRGHVMISKLSADTNNFYMHSRGLYYELAEDQPEIKPKEEPKKPGRPKKQ